MVKRDGLLLSIVLVLSVSMSNLWPQGGHAMPFALKTTAFSAGESIPKKYTCDGSDLSPALTWANAPAGTQSLALIADDPDAPVGTWTHWIAWNIPLQSALPESLAKIAALSDGTRQGKNDFRRIGYGGPCPPPGTPHRYFFKLYALDSKLDLKPGGAGA
jgi:Raf kinase inhibitor-like YbhB/YbcL family protein